MFMSDAAIKAEADIHALIHSKISIFLPTGNLEYLTGRDDWADINTGHGATVTQELIDKLRRAGSNRQDGFIARKNGHLGQWVEMEYASLNRDNASELEEIYTDEPAPTSTDLIARAAWAATMLQHQWPDANFHVIEGHDTWNGRVCLGVFLPEDIGNRAEIIDSFYATELPKLDLGVVKQLYGGTYDEVDSYFAALNPVPEPAKAIKM